MSNSKAGRRRADRSDNLTAARFFAGDSAEVQEDAGREENLCTGNLYQLTLGLIRELGNEIQKDLRVDFEGFGIVSISHPDPATIRIFYEVFERTFELKDGDVLVEKIAPRFEPPPSEESLPSAPEQYFRCFVDDGQVPRRGKGVVVQYGEYGYSCILTPHPRGVRANFVEERVILIWDKNTDTIRPYREYSSERRRELTRILERKKKRSARMVDPVEQLDYHGRTEVVDRAVFRNRLVCSCGNVRYVRNSQLKSVSRCKPCQYELVKLRVPRKKHFARKTPLPKGWSED